MIQPASGPKRKSEAGYNLIEVIVAMALMSTVLLSIVTLFFFGRSNVYSGKQLTLATSVGTRVLEDLSSMSALDVYRNFGLSNATTRAGNTIDGVTYPLSVVRHTDAIVAGAGNSDAGGYMQDWKTNLLPSTRFHTARISLVITPSAFTSAATAFSTAQFVRVRVIVEWSESTRRRHAIFDTTKVNRT